MKLEHNLSPEELTMALAASVMDAGIEDDLIDVLSKSRRGGGEKPSEPEVISLISRWKSQHRSLTSLLKQSIDIWIDAKRTTYVPNKGWWFFSAPEEVQSELSIDDITELEALIYAQYRQAAFTTFSGITMEAYNRGRKAGTRMMASTYAGLHAAGYMDSLASRVANKVLQAGIESLQSNYPGTVAHFVNQGRKEVDQWAQLGKIAKEAISDSDWKRDSNRIAESELRWAFNTGRLQHIVSQGHDRVIFQVQGSACNHCKSLYLNPDGSSRIFHLKTLLKEVADNGGTNIGRDEGEYKPTMLTHPFCHCFPVPYEE